MDTETKAISKSGDFKFLRKDFKVMEKLGEGTYGVVYLVRHRETRKKFAAKYIRNFTENSVHAKYVYREVAILSQLTKMGVSNCFTTPLHQIVLAGEPDSFNSLFLIMDKMETNLRSLLCDTTMQL